MQGAGLRPLECPCPRFPPVRPVEINGEMWLCPFECGFGPREPGPRSWLRLSPGVMRWAPEHKSPGEKGHRLSPDTAPLFGAVRPRRLLQGSQAPPKQAGRLFLHTLPLSPGRQRPLFCGLTGLIVGRTTVEPPPAARGTGRLPRRSGRSSLDLCASPGRKCWGRSWEARVRVGGQSGRYRGQRAASSNRPRAEPGAGTLSSRPSSHQGPGPSEQSWAHLGSLDCPRERARGCPWPRRSPGAGHRPRPAGHRQTWPWPSDLQARPPRALPGWDWRPWPGGDHTCLRSEVLQGLGTANAPQEAAAGPHLAVTDRLARPLSLSSGWPCPCPRLVKPHLRGQAKFRVFTNEAVASHGVNLWVTRASNQPTRTCASHHGLKSASRARTVCPTPCAPRPPPLVSHPLYSHPKRRAGRPLLPHPAKEAVPPAGPPSAAPAW